MLIKGKHRRRAPACQRAAGFTMIEILMTMLLLSVVMIGLAALQITTIRQVTASRRTGEAMRLAQSLLERHQTMPIAQVENLTPVGSWFTLLKKDESTQMVNVGPDGESDGPYTAQRMIELVQVNGVDHYIITIRVSWLNLIPGAEVDPTQRYRTLDVLMSCRRAI